MMKSMKLFGLAIVAMLALGACATTDTIKKDPAALKGDYSGKDFSGSYAVIATAGNIPHAPTSNGKQARWSATERDQLLYLDAHCQAELFKQLPGWAQAIVTEGGWSALAIAVGEGAFASAFPGAAVARYVLGGLGYGAFAGMNTGRYRQDGSEKSAQAYCVMMQVWDTRNRYHILEGINVIPWYGNGNTEMPKPTSDAKKPTLPHVSDRGLPPFTR